MSSNFLNLSGFFAGMDFHWWIWMPVPPAPVPVPDPHLVMQSHWVGRLWRVAWSVTDNGAAVVQNGYGMLLIPHIPCPVPPPHGTQLANWIAINITSSSTPPLAAHTVKAEGAPKLAEFFGAFGANVDCSLLPFPPLNVDVNIGTVSTTPTHGDFVAGVVGLIAGGVYSMFTAAITPLPVCYGVYVLQLHAEIADRYQDLTVIDKVVRWLDPFGRAISNLQGAIQDHASR